MAINTTQLKKFGLTIDQSREIFKRDGLLNGYRKNGRWYASQKNYEKWLKWSLIPKQWFLWLEQRPDHKQHENTRRKKNQLPRECRL